MEPTNNPQPRPDRAPRPEGQRVNRPQTPSTPNGAARNSSTNSNTGTPRAQQPSTNGAAPAAGGQPNRGPRPAGRGNGNGGGQKRGSNFTSKGTRHRGQKQRPILPDPNATPVNRSVYNGIDGEQAVNAKPAPTAAPTGASIAAEITEARVANTVTREDKVRVIPLGGLGEVGKNMMAIEYGNDMIIIDMGFGFPDETQPGIDYIIPDITYLEKNKHKLRGHVITHGHMDHIGAAGYVLPKLQAPVYGSRLSLAMVEKQIEEFHLQVQPQFRVIDPDSHEKVQLGVFQIELVRVTHSIPDACAVVVTTPVGKIIHTGDWRLDPDPIDVKPMDLARLEELGKEGVLLLMSDSTNCERVGRTPSERVIEPTLLEVFKRTKGRIIISSFASSVNRVQLMINAAQASNRKLAFAGRSMLANVEIAVKLGYLKVPPGLIMRVQDIIRRPDEEVVVLCTGSQGEANSALNRMSTGDHPFVKLKPGDTVVLSSSTIPGNEKAVVATIDNLLREGAKVFTNVTRELDGHGLLHVSGHASRDDIVDILNLIKPKYFLPIHGEFHMLVRHAELAVHNGMAPSSVFVFDNGDVLELSDKGAKKGTRVQAGPILVDGTGVGDVENVVLRDRVAMSTDGIFVVIGTVDRRTGKLIGSPDIISRGFVYMKDSEELIGKARGLVRQNFEKRNKASGEDWSKFKLRLRDDLSDLLYKKTKRNPMIIPVVNEI
jgi:ribonuclease J